MTYNEFLDLLFAELGRKEYDELTEQDKQVMFENFKLLNDPNRSR